MSVGTFCEQSWSGRVRTNPRQQGWRVPCWLGLAEEQVEVRCLRACAAERVDRGTNGAAAERESQSDPQGSCGSSTEAPAGRCGEVDEDRRDHECRCSPEELDYGEDALEVAGGKRKTGDEQCRCDRGAESEPRQARADEGQHLAGRYLNAE